MKKKTSQETMKYTLFSLFVPISFLRIFGTLISYQEHLGSPAGAAQWLSVVPCTKKSPVPFLDRTHAQVGGLISKSGQAGGSQLMFPSHQFLSLSPFPFLSLKTKQNTWVINIKQKVFLWGKIMKQLFAMKLDLNLE